MDNVELAGKLYVIYHKEMEGNKLTNVLIKDKGKRFKGKDKALQYPQKEGKKSI